MAQAVKGLPFPPSWRDKPGPEALWPGDSLRPSISSFLAHLDSLWARAMATQQNGSDAKKPRTDGLPEDIKQYVDSTRDEVLGALDGVRAAVGVLTSEVSTSYDALST